MEMPIRCRDPPRARRLPGGKTGDPFRRDPVNDPADVRGYDPGPTFVSPGLGARVPTRIPTGRLAMCPRHLWTRVASVVV